MIVKRIVAEVDAMLDKHVSTVYKDQPLAQSWARIAKIQEEAGEAVSEFILFTGQNPRKPADDAAYGRMLNELADTAMTAIYAIQHFTKDSNITAKILMDAQVKHNNRLTEVTQ